MYDALGIPPAVVALMPHDMTELEEPSLHHPSMLVPHNMPPSWTDDEAMAHPAGWMIGDGLSYGLMCLVVLSSAGGSRRACASVDPTHKLRQGRGKVVGEGGEEETWGMGGGGVTRRSVC